MAKLPKVRGQRHVHVNLLEAGTNELDPNSNPTAQPLPVQDDNGNEVEVQDSSAHAHDPNNPENVEVEEEEDDLKDPVFKPVNLKCLGGTNCEVSEYRGLINACFVYILLGVVINLMFQFFVKPSTYADSYAAGMGQVTPEDLGLLGYIFWAIPQFGGQNIAKFTEGSCRSIYTTNNSLNEFRITTQWKDRNVELFSDCIPDPEARLDGVACGQGGLFTLMFLIEQGFAVWVILNPTVLGTWSKMFKDAWTISSVLVLFWKLMTLIQLIVTWVTARGSVETLMIKDVVHDPHGNTFPSYTWTKTQKQHYCCGLHSHKFWSYNESFGGYPRSCCNDMRYFCENLPIVTEKEVWGYGCLDQEMTKIHVAYGLRLFMNLWETGCMILLMFTVLRYYEKMRRDFIQQKWEAKKKAREEAAAAVAAAAENEDPEALPAQGGPAI